MRIYTSYYAQIRNFPRSLLPIGTNPGPKFFKKGGLHFDKRGIINGISLLTLKMPEEQYLEINEYERCDKCKHDLDDCQFMIRYKKYLDSLDFNIAMNAINEIFRKAKVIIPELEDVALMVYESDKCKCCERPVIQQWFREHGVEVYEYDTRKESTK